MPDNPFAKELERRSNPFAAEIVRREEQPGAMASYLNSSWRAFNNAALGLPRFAGDALAATGAALRTPVDAVFNPDGNRSFGEHFEDLRGRGPIRMLRSDALNPTATDVEAAMRSIPALMPGGETPQEAFGRNTQAIEQQIASEQEAHPIASGAGNLAGNAAALVTARQPLARPIRSLEQRLNPPRPDMAFGSAAVADDASKATSRLVMERMLQGGGMRRLARGFGRAIEAGTEAAFLESVNRGDDPLLMAGVGAGTQMAGSASLGIFDSIKSKSMGGLAMNLTAAAFATGGLMQLAKSGTPGGDNYILPSLETGFEKVMFGLALGAGAAVSGFARPGRGSANELSNRLVRLSDAIATTPRAATLTLLTSLNDASPEEQAQFELVNSTLMEDPMYFGRHASERLGRAYRNGTVLTELERLSRVDSFAEKLRALESGE